MDSGMVKAAGLLMLREFYVAEMFEAKPSDLLCWLGDVVFEGLRSLNL